jgi:translation initiation factor 2 subunit 1
VKVGQRVVALVLKVEPEKNFISLSLKRVNKREKERKLQEFRKEEKAEKMLELVGKELGMDLDKAYEKIGFPLQEIFGEMYAPFELAREKPDLLEKKGIPKKYVKVISEIAKKAIEEREIKMKAIVELKCFEGEGIERIKDILLKTQKKFGVKISYIAAPNYSLTLTHKDPKAAEKEMKKIAEFMEKLAKNANCEFSMRRE